MSRSLLIRAPYGLTEDTQVATGLADLFESAGWKVLLGYENRAKGPINARWDHRAAVCDQELFQQVINGCSHVMWIGLPQPTEVEVMISMGLASCVVLPCDRCNKDNIKYLRVVDKLVTLCPSLKAELSVGNKGGCPIHYIPWDSSLQQLTSNGCTADSTRVCFMLADSQPGRVHIELMPVMESVLVNMPGSTLLVLFAKGWSKAASKRFRQLQSEFGDRITVESTGCLEKRQRLMNECCLCVWVPAYESFPLAGYTALASCVPVITWDAPAVRNALNSKNSVLVGCKIDKHELMWLVDPDYANLEDELLTLLADKDKLASLAANCSADRERRRTEFLTGWSKLW